MLLGLFFKFENSCSHSLLLKKEISLDFLPDSSFSVPQIEAFEQKLLVKLSFKYRLWLS